MKIFKTIDEKFKDIGFKKVEDDQYLVTYANNIQKYKHIQGVNSCHKQNGRHIIQSYDKDLFDKKGIGNTCVGLTYYETQLALKKMKKKKWHK